MSFTVKDIFRMEVAPALGCTEPVAIALATASAASLIPEHDIESIQVWVDPNIYKNGIAVTIPGTGGLCGLDLAAALGAFGGDPHLRLEVLDPIDEVSVNQARNLVSNGKVEVNLLIDRQGIYVRSVLRTKKHTAECVIEKVHDNIVELLMDGKPVTENGLLGNEKNGNLKNRLDELETWLKKLKLADLLLLIDDLDADDFTFLGEGISHNMLLADYGLKHGDGLGIGKALQRLVRQKLVRNDMIIAARMLTSAAADARMSGVKLAAMSSAGSGNHGLTAILPIVAIKDFIEVDESTVLESIGLSHIITAYIKAFTGRLSAICGCSVAAGAGATAGVTYLLGGNIHHIAGAISNLIEDLAGVICDGAKAGCALKLATAAGNAVEASLFALQGVNVSSTDGIIGATAEDTMKSVGKLATEGMIETDRTILKIMLEKRFSGY